MELGEKSWNLDKFAGEFLDVSWVLLSWVVLLWPLRVGLFLGICRFGKC